MKLLYIIPSFQHPRVRGPNRHYHLVRELSERHDITLLVLNRSTVGAEALAEVASYVKQLHVIDINATAASTAALARQIPLAGRRIEQMLRLSNGVNRMRATFERLIAEDSYDLVVFHGKSVFPVIEQCRNIPIVVDFCDATSMRIRNKLRFANILMRPFLWYRYADIRRIERGILKKTPHVAFIAPRDREAILGPGSRAEILPNGVDHEYWKRTSKRPESRCIAFVGVMDYAPNNDAALHLIENIAPQVRQVIPDLEVLIVGRDPSLSLLEKAARSPRVTVTGFVDDVRPYLERAAVFAAPLRYASGTQNKVLEAMSMELPTVTTSTVADGLQMDDADTPPVVVADSDAEFAAAIVRLLQDRVERDSLAVRGRLFVENHFIWSRSAEKLERICRAAIGPRSEQPLGVTP